MNSMLEMHLQRATRLVIHRTWCDMTLPDENMLTTLPDEVSCRACLELALDDANDRTKLLTAALTSLKEGL